jgi:hypothetical protein
MKNLHLFFYLFVFLISTQTACLPFLTVNRSSQKPISLQSLPQPPLKPQFTEVFDLTSKKGVIEKDTYQLLLNKDFDSIEKVTTKAREKKERLLGGYWKIDSVYKALTNIYSTDSKIELTDEMWKNHINLLKEWKNLSPKSTTARVALAESYVNYGWFVRGIGLAYTVSDEAFAILHEQLDIAQQELLDAEELGLKCPRGYRTMLWIAMTNGWSTDKYDELFEEAVKSEPNYIQFYILKSERLLPKWRGEKGEWGKFVESVPKNLVDLHSNESDMFYFILAANKSADSTVREDWAALSNERVKKGFSDLEKTYGVDSYRLNQYAQFSFRRMDLTSCKETFDRIGDDWNQEVWSKESFNFAKKNAALASAAPEKTKY